MKIFPISVAMACMLLLAGGTLDAQAGSPGKVVLSYSLNRLARIASNQLAVWIEDGSGRYVATVFATDFMDRRADRRHQRGDPETGPDFPELGLYRRPGQARPAGDLSI
jgi:hypothetical protein